VLRFENIVKRFGATTVLQGMSFEVAAGRAFALCGLNGAGKTTLIKCLLDLAALDAGEIHIGGIPHRQHRARARLAFLPERFVPPWHLTGSEFIAFILALNECRCGEHEVQAMLARLDLDLPALKRPVRTYSKGMTQKLGLAVCFLAHRDVYVLDEPMSGLDAKARASVKSLLAEAHARGATLFLTSHALADIEELCDELLVLHRGVSYFAGTPASLCEYCGESSLERAFLRCIEAPRHVREPEP
jgi:ABC-2 type transport system ATP-binding protein